MDSNLDLAPASIRVTPAEFRSIRRYLDGIGDEIVYEPCDRLYPSAPRGVRIHGTERALAALGAAIAADWPANGYDPLSCVWPARHAVYGKIETALTVPSA